MYTNSALNLLSFKEDINITFIRVLSEEFVYSNIISKLRKEDNYDSNQQVLLHGRITL